MKKRDAKKYIYSFVITLFIFSVAIFASKFISNSKINELSKIQEEISLAIISNEISDNDTGGISCQDILNRNYKLSSEIGTLAEKITFLEEGGNTSDEISVLKENYTLLLIKDYLATLKVDSDCDLGLSQVLFFYSNNDCDQCVEQGYVLTALREKYDFVRVYSFDEGIELGSQKVLMDKYGIKGPYPVVYINGKVYNGFQSLSKLEGLIN